MSSTGLFQKLLRSDTPNLLRDEFDKAFGVVGTYSLVAAYLKGSPTVDLRYIEQLTPEQRTVIAKLRILGMDIRTAADDAP